MTLRTAEDRRNAILFVQSLPPGSVPIGLFWPERLAQSSIFRCHSIAVHAGSSDASTLAAAIRSVARQHHETAVVTFDLEDLRLVHRALAQFSPQELAGISRVVFFSPPEKPIPLIAEAKRADAKLPRTVCITFDERRFEDVPFALAACSQLVLARMDPSMTDAPPCDDAIFPIFEVGLASELAVKCDQ